MSKMNEPSSPLQMSPQATLKIDKSERTRAAILNSALDFIWTHPFRDMTVNSIMAPVDVGRTAFYQHFRDLHEVMEILLDTLTDEVNAVTGPWFKGIGDPVVLLSESLHSVVDLCYHRGPILRAIGDAAPTDKRLEKSWTQFIGVFNDGISTRIEADQGQGLIPTFAARPVAIGLNHLNVYTVIDAFGRRPRSEPEPVQEALARIWISTLYGSEWVGKVPSNLVRT